MSLELASPIGLVAGDGAFPVEVARSARARGLKVFAIAHTGETDPALETEVDSCAWVKIGQLGKVIRLLARAGVKQATMVGGISRVRILGGVHLDWAGVRLIARLGSVKDDILLRGIAEEIERSGVHIFSPTELLTSSTPRVGSLTRRGLTAQERKDAEVGWLAAKRIGAVDIGQTVVAAQGVVVAVEAVEGTDAAIRRAGRFGGRGGVVVKVAKPQQDLRLDLPAVGRNTISSMVDAGLTALILEAGKAVILFPHEVVAMAEKAGIAIVAFENL